LTNLSDKYLIIEAGPSGLCIARSFKESGVPYDQIEADDDVGGNWCHGAYKTANILSSRDVTEFPMPASCPLKSTNYCHRRSQLRIIKPRYH